MKGLKYWRRGLRHSQFLGLGDEGEEQEYTSQELVLQHASNEKDRAAAFSEYLALAVAEENNAVRRFRRRILGGRLLAPGQAHDLVESPAAAHFPIAWFKRFRVPVIGHSATFDPLAEGFDEGGPYRLARMRLDPRKPRG